MVSRGPVSTDEAEFLRGPGRWSLLVLPLVLSRPRLYWSASSLASRGGGGVAVRGRLEGGALGRHCTGVEGRVRGVRGVGVEGGELRPGQTEVLVRVLGGQTGLAGGGVGGTEGLRLRLDFCYLSHPVRTEEALGTGPDFDVELRLRTSVG